MIGKSCSKVLTLAINSSQLGFLIISITWKQCPTQNETQTFQNSSHKIISFLVPRFPRALFVAKVFGFERVCLFFIVSDGNVCTHPAGEKCGKDGKRDSHKCIPPLNEWFGKEPISIQNGTDQETSYIKFNIA